jgi:hypothetical protein
MTITNTDFQNIALAIGAYSDEAYTNARKISSTDLVGSHPDIHADGESFVGQFRYFETLNPTINVASLSDDTYGTETSISTQMANYVKTVRTFGASQVNLQNVVSKADGLAKIARDFAEVKAQDEHNATLAVLKGVALSEVTKGDKGGAGAGGYISFDTDGDAATVGHFVDVNALGTFGAAATGAGDERPLFDSTAAGAARGERLFQAIGMAFKDYEPDFMYMLTSPENLAQMRAANLVDETKIVDGNLELSTLFGGKFRLVPTRASQMITGAPSNDLNARSSKCTFIIKPGSVINAPVNVDLPVEVERTAGNYKGGGSSKVWHRWGHINHPVGYDLAGATNAFATDATLGAAASYTRKFDALNLGILPIFHS